MHLHSKLLLAGGAVVLLSLSLTLWTALRRSAEQEEVEAAAEGGSPPPPEATPSSETAAVLAAVPADVAPLFLPVEPSSLYTTSQGELGAGGFGSVARGRARASGEAVAIKCFRLGQEEAEVGAAVRALRLAPGSARAAEVQRRVLARRAELASASRSYAQHEVRALQAVKGLRSPCFIDMLTAHSAGGHYYIVTALAGATTEASLPALPLRQRLVVLQRAAAALAHLHAAGCAHRDLKLDNIATRPGEPLQPVILDLGLLLLPSPHPDPITTGCVPYLPPEHFQGGGGQRLLSHTALAQARDVFALGCALAMLAYECQQPPTLFAYALAQMGVLALGSSGSGGGGGGAAALPSGRDGYTDFMALHWTPALVSSALDYMGAPEGHLRELVAGMLHPSPVQRPAMASVACDRAFAIVAETGEMVEHPAPGPATAIPPHVLSALPFDHEDGVHAAWQRNLARNTRLALMRDVVRVAAELEEAEGGGGAVPAPGHPRHDTHVHDLLPRLQLALGQRQSVSRGSEFDALLAGVGLNTAALPFEHGELFTLLDSDESGGVERRELLAGLAFLLSARLSQEEECRLVFQAFDLDSSGSLSRAEVVDMLAAYGIPKFSASAAEAAAGEAAVQALFERLDRNGDGSVSCGELLQGMRQEQLLAKALHGDMWVRGGGGREGGAAEGWWAAVSAWLGGGKATSLW